MVQLISISVDDLQNIIKQSVADKEGNIKYNLFKFVGIGNKVLNGGIVRRPVYAATNNINYKSRGFTLNEGSTKTFIDSNMSPDYTDLSLQFTDSFKQKIGEFMVADPQNALNAEINRSVDETFNNACLIFGIISDISLEDFSSNLDNSKYKKYKQEFKHIVDFLNDRNITKN